MRARRESNETERAMRLGQHHQGWLLRGSGEGCSTGFINITSFKLLAVYIGFVLCLNSEWSDHAAPVCWVVSRTVRNNGNWVWTDAGRTFYVSVTCLKVAHLYHGDKSALRSICVTQSLPSFSWLFLWLLLIWRLLKKKKSNTIRRKFA